MPQPPLLTTPFSVHPGRSDAGLLGRVAALVAPMMDPLLGLTTLGRLYAGLPDGNFIDRALERLGVSVAVTDEDLRRVPATGPVIVVANHPTGALDGLALAHALFRRRSDVRLLGNHLLSRVPEMRHWTIAVNPFDPRSIENRRGLREAREWLRRGGLLVVFPAGEVSNVAREDGVLVDRDWQQGVLGLVRWSSAAVAPAYLDARSSLWFRLASLIHPRLRTALLPRELLRLRNRAVHLRLGIAVTSERLGAIGNPTERLAYLRARTYALEPTPRSVAVSAPQEIADPVPASALAANIAALPAPSELVRSGDYSVYCAGAPMLPAILPEIGRLREVTFREAGEGTGRTLDLDRFDRQYRHLFVWNRAKAEVVGAYRIGETDRLAAGGVTALYTHTLFKLRDGFLDAAGPALELGRSFVRREYQRESHALLLLWKGIGAIVAREPRYRRLFGPVSISAGYSRASQAVLAQFFDTAGVALEWRDRVRPRRPYSRPGQCAGPLTGRAPRSLEDVDAVLRDIDGRRVPVLLRQYWKLGARALGLSVDPAFGNCLDVLMMIDLTRLTAAQLQRYLGPEGAVAFRRHHGQPSPAPALEPELVVEFDH